MKRKAWLCAVSLFCFLCFPAVAQYSDPAAEANNIFLQINQASSNTQRDVAQLRIDKWKIDGDARRLAESRAESISRNLAAALPAILDASRVAPNSLGANFKLYRNLSALNDVLGSLVDQSAKGPDSDHNGLKLDFDNFERARVALGDRLERLSASADVDLAKLRAGVKNQTATAPKKVIIDDTEPAPKKPRRPKATP